MVGKLSLRANHLFASETTGDMMLKERGGSKPPGVPVTFTKRTSSGIERVLLDMSPAVKAALFLIVLFAIPVVPFLWLGESFEQSLLKALREPSSLCNSFSVVVVLNKRHPTP